MFVLKSSDKSSIKILKQNLRPEAKINDSLLLIGVIKYNLGATSHGVDLRKTFPRSKKTATNTDTIHADFFFRNFIHGLDLTKTAVPYLRSDHDAIHTNSGRLAAANAIFSSQIKILKRASDS